MIASLQKKLTAKRNVIISLAILSCLNQTLAFQSIPLNMRLRSFQPEQSNFRRILLQPLRETEDANTMDMEAADIADDEGNGKDELKTVTARFINDNDLVIVTDEDGRVTARPMDDVDNKTSRKATSQSLDSKSETKKVEKIVDAKDKKKPAVKNKKSIKKRVTKFLKEEIPKPVVSGGFNVVLTHCTADFDSLASAIGLAKLWSNDHPAATKESSEFQSSQNLPTFVVLPRGMLKRRFQEINTLTSLAQIYLSALTFKLNRLPSRRTKVSSFTQTSISNPFFAVSAI